MHRKSKAVLLLMFATCALWTLPTRAENPQVTVSVYNDVQLPSDTLNRAEEHTTKLFLRAGLDISWLDCTHSSTAVCNEIGRPDHLFLRITPKVGNFVNNSVFGVAFLGSNGTGYNADVFWNRVQQTQATSKVDAALILGSVMAHEIGHLLLGSNAHSVNGIMQAHWKYSELRRISMGNLEFLPEQAKRMRAKLPQQKTTHHIMWWLTEEKSPV